MASQGFRGVGTAGECSFFAGAHACACRALGNLEKSCVS